MQGNWYNPEKQRILEMVDLADLVGEQLQLKRSGREYKAICPFHDDSHPSMFINPQKGIYKCFACGAGGNALTWLEKYFHMTRGEAWKMLSERTGIELHYEERSARKVGGNRNAGGAVDDDGDGEFIDLDPAEIVRAHETALSFYRTILKHPEHGSAARAIFAGRGISDEMIERFQLGASPGGDIWDGLVRTLNKREIDICAFTASGLVSRRRSGDGYIDRFRNRLIFPIHDLLGRPIAFGARKIDPADEPKYLNSPEHARFNKSATLYGLHLAQRSIQKLSQAIVVEGYTDVIACHQAGVDNAVATLGTALTRQHAMILQRFCDGVVLLFDGDEAGRKAADRAVEIFFQSSVDIKMGMLPEGCDPADLLSRESGREEFDRVIDKAEDALSYLLNMLREQVHETEGSVSGRQRVIQEFLSRLGRLGFHSMPSLRRDIVIPRLADMLSMNGESILKEIPRARPGRFGGADEIGDASVLGDSASAVPSGRIAAECGILGCLLILPRLYFEKSGESGDGVRARVGRIHWSVTGHGELMKRYAAYFEDMGEAAKEFDRLPDFGDTELDALAVELCYKIDKQTKGGESESTALFLDRLLKSIDEFEAARAVMEVAGDGEGMDQLQRISRLRELQANDGRRRAVFLSERSAAHVSSRCRDESSEAGASVATVSASEEDLPRGSEVQDESGVSASTEPIESEHEDE